MRRTSVPFGLTVLIAAAIGRATIAHAVCDVPLNIAHTSGSANVLVILDNSGSMNEAVYHDAYDENRTYSGRFTSTDMYTVSDDGTYTPRNFRSSWPNSPSAYLVDSDRSEDGRYIGNYLNWIYFNATATQRAAIPRVTRIQVAKQAVNSVLSVTTGCSFGVMTFNDDNGGTLVSPIGTAIATLQSQVNNIRADAWTPLAETLVDAIEYFGTTGANAPIGAACERSFAIIVTDGYPTQDRNIPNYIPDYDHDHREPGSCTSLGAPYPNSYNCSEWLDDVAAYGYRNDLRDDLDGIQNLASFVVGFNLDAPILQQTALAGGGSYYSSRDVTGLSTALSEAFQVIERRVSAGASVSVVSSEDRADNRLFRARYESQTWKGYVETFSLPYHANDLPLWESGQLLANRSPDTRTIFTSSTGTNLIAFSSASATTLQSLLGAANVTEATNIIQYIRGNAVVGMRDREGWRLGDIVDAAPTLVGRPLGFNEFLGYQAFKTANAGRNEVLYVAANDGMMHCFDADDGSELWAYVPKNQLSRLRNLTSTSYCHEYFVNMTPAVYDIYMNGAWKTILIGGQERGGSGLFALDITDPSSANIRLLWDVDISALSGSWNTPTLVRDPIRNSYVLCVGTGYSAASSQQRLLTLDPRNGTVLSIMNLGSPVAGSKMTRATAVDTDLNGYENLVYINDLTGRVWRVDVTVSPWTSSLLFNAGRPIQAPPIAGMDAQGRPMVFFGSGKYLVDSDPANRDMQGFYGIIDNGSGSTVTLANMVDQTSTFHPLNSSHRGWYLNLGRAGERITRTAGLIAGTLYVPSFLPNAGECSGGGQSWLYSLDFEDGSAPDNPHGGENNTTAGRVESMGDGILADPSVDLVNEDIILQSSNAVLMSHDINGGVRALMVRSWRQDLD